MRINHYEFPDSISMDEMKVLAKEFGLEITLDVPEDVARQYLLEIGCIDTLDQDVPKRWLQITLNGGSEHLDKGFKKFPYPIKYIQHHISGYKITTIKKLLKKYGGNAYSEFFNRSNGEFYGCTPIELTGRNQRVGYKIKA